MSWVQAAIGIASAAATLFGAHSKHKQSKLAAKSAKTLEGLSGDRLALAREMATWQAAMMGWQHEMRLPGIKLGHDAIDALRAGMAAGDFMPQRPALPQRTAAQLPTWGGGQESGIRQPGAGTAPKWQEIKNRWPTQARAMPEMPQIGSPTVAEGVGEIRGRSNFDILNSMISHQGIPDSDRAWLFDLMNENPGLANDYSWSKNTPEQIVNSIRTGGLATENQAKLIRALTSAGVIGGNRQNTV